MTDNEREKQKEFLNEHLPYRMVKLDGLIWACQASSRYGHGADLVISVDTYEEIRGPLKLITNPLEEAGLIKCREVANFLGMVRKNGKIDFIGKPDKSDYHISKLQQLTSGTLTNVARDDIASRYGPETDKVIDSCYKTLTWASLASAHLKNTGDKAKCEHSIRCAKALLWLVEEKVYKALNWPLKHYKLWTEPPQ